MTPQMARDDSFMLMETFMLENGKTIKPMDKESTPIWMELFIKESGKRTSNMVME